MERGIQTKLPQVLHDMRMLQCSPWCSSLEHLLLGSFRVPVFRWRTEMMQIQEPLS